MVDICIKYINKRNLKFGTDPNPQKSKTKCLIFSMKKVMSPKAIKLNENYLPWFSQVKHLGCTIEAQNCLNMDMVMKKYAFNNKVYSLLQEFHYATPSVLLKCVNTYFTSFVGSQLWRLSSPQCEGLFNSWNVMVRQIFRVDRTPIGAL